MTERPSSCTRWATRAAPFACAVGSPPSSVTPSMPCAVAFVIADTTSSRGDKFPPSNGNISGLQQPGQRNGHPCNHSANRLPGPSASVTGTTMAIDKSSAGCTGMANSVYQISAIHHILERVRRRLVQCLGCPGFIRAVQAIEDGSTTHDLKAMLHQLSRRVRSEEHTSELQSRFGIS